VTVGEWLDTRTPPAPAALAARLRSAVGAALSNDAIEAPGVLLAAAEERLRAFVAEGEGARQDALDLLAIDALVTYAFEAAADAAPDETDELARGAVARIAALVGAGAGSSAGGAAT
jgi:uncharacterized membrane protein